LAFSRRIADAVEEDADADAVVEEEEEEEGDAVDTVDTVDTV
jgi:hypothetical protein